MKLVEGESVMYICGSISTPSLDEAKDWLDNRVKKYDPERACILEVRTITRIVVDARPPQELIAEVEKEV